MPDQAAEGGVRRFGQTLRHPFLVIGFAHADLDQLVVEQGAVDRGDDAGRDAAGADLDDGLEFMGEPPQELAVFAGEFEPSHARNVEQAPPRRKSIASERRLVWRGVSAILVGMIPTQPFGSTGHQSSRVIFGAAALASLRQEKADALLPLLLEHGVNHIDTAASYGESELRLGPWMEQHRTRFFLASKTGARDYAGAWASLRQSLANLRVAQLDLIQLHNLVDEQEWEQAFAADGAVRAMVEARDQGLVRFLGVTGHGTRVAAMHRRSLERFPFDSVLLPCNFAMLSQPDYRRDFESLLQVCAERGVAVQTIKAIARRRWQEGDTQKRFSWYEPLTDEAAIARAVRFVFGFPGVFLNSSMDTRCLPPILRAAGETQPPPTAAELQADAAAFEVQPLFVPGVLEGI